MLDYGQSYTEAIHAGFTRYIKTSGMYSQFNEEEIILEYFGDYKGFLVDIGANDGFRLSNSRRLLLDGWHGVLIEPQQEQAEKCWELYMHRKDVNVTTAAISTKTGDITFYKCEDDLYSGANEDAVKWWGRQYKEVTVKSYSWDWLNENIRKNIDFLTIDTEESDWDILQQIDLTDIKLICFEKGKKVKEMEEYCKTFGKRKIGETPVNLLYGD